MSPEQFGQHPPIVMVLCVPDHLQLTANDHGTNRQIDSYATRTALPIPLTTLHESFQERITVSIFKPAIHPYGFCVPETFLSLKTRAGERHYRVQDPDLSAAAGRAAFSQSPDMAVLLAKTIQGFEAGARMGFEQRHLELLTAVSQGRVQLKQTREGASLHEAPAIESLQPYADPCVISEFDRGLQPKTVFRAGVEIGKYHGGHPIVKTTLPLSENAFATREEALTVAKAMIPEIYAQEFPWTDSKKLSHSSRHADLPSMG